MNAEQPWPRWLSPEQLDVVRTLSAMGFRWTIGNEPAATASEVRGQWAQGVAQEINVMLRVPRNDQATTSFVGVYPHGQGFWHGSREPSMVDADWSHSGTVDEVLDSASTAAKERAAGVHDGSGTDRPSLRVVRGEDEDSMTDPVYPGGASCPVSITLRGYFEVEYFRDALAGLALDLPRPAMTELDQVHVALGVVLQAVQRRVMENAQPDILMDFGEHNGSPFALISVVTDKPPPDRPRCG